MTKGRNSQASKIFFFSFAKVIPCKSNMLKGCRPSHEVAAWEGGVYFIDFSA